MPESASILSFTRVPCGWVHVQPLCGSMDRRLKAAGRYVGRPRSVRGWSCPPSSCPARRSAGGHLGRRKVSRWTTFVLLTGPGPCSASATPQRRRRACVGRPGCPWNACASCLCRGQRFSLSSASPRCSRRLDTSCLGRPRALIRWLHTRWTRPRRAGTSFGLRFARTLCSPRTKTSVASAGSGAWEACRTWSHRRNRGRSSFQGSTPSLPGATRHTRQATGTSLGATTSTRTPWRPAFAEAPEVARSRLSRV
ncbi:hypothetical protein DMC30DRAFT_192225 [Rhodotorula diobovata]|uniref:Uncharacterized protein n=1 Tax=Rhodotorula diobovata TaxID=5288 RepID=A0A5C5G575_9BASI|nr:hypothetical protein DMC30DRAFT_192225 [Rhodotorula diobovata]